MKDYRVAAPLHTWIIMLAVPMAACAQAVTDPNLKLQTWVSGLDQPTGAAFVDNGNTTLVLEKSTGRIKIVQNRRVTGTALDLPVASDSERGLLGIALPPEFAASKSVYLYYTH